MLRPFNAHDLAAIAPLLDLARAKGKAERDLWINDLRQDAPLLMSRIEAIVETEERALTDAVSVAASMHSRRAQDPSVLRALCAKTLGWLGR